MTITYKVQPIAEVDAALLLDLNTQSKTHAVIRTSEISAKAWSFHTNAKTAEAAARRWRMRDVVTR
jgi:hypothetical protein